jgi:LacI family transcriptional regulator
MSSNYWTQTSIEAYLAWCERHDQRPHVEFVLEDSDEALRESASRLLEAHPRPDAVYGLYELPAVALLRQAVEMGIDVPGELMVAAPGDFGVGASMVPAMTTLDYDGELLGREAARMLIQLIRGEDPAEPHKLLPLTVIERESTRHLPDHCLCERAQTIQRNT